MGPRPYSDKSSLPVGSSIDIMPGIPTEALPETPPPTLSNTTTPSPTSLEQILIEPLVESTIFQETNEMPNFEAPIPCYPTPGDIMPYDHSLPDFIRQITNQPNLSNLHSLSLRVISTLISLHRMSTYLPNLRELDLEGSILNSLRDIGCNFKSLQILKVGRCQLESLDGTFGLTNLRELYAEKNYINDVSPCSNLPHIRHIDVSSNRIRNISYAGFLSVCKKLKSIVFTGNPATEVPDYRKHVRRILPQIETLDDVSFINEENVEEFKESEILENYCGESDSSSTEMPDFSSVSPSDSMNNFFEPEEDLLHLDKKNKQAKNLASQDQTEGVEIETEEVLSDIQTKIQIQDDLQNFNLSKVKKGLLEKTKIIEARNENIKQKCTSIQKLDKDIENRSKKSNLLLNTKLKEELILFSESNVDFSKFRILEETNLCSPSTSASVVASEDFRKTETAEIQSAKPSTTFGLSYCDSDDMKREKMEFGTKEKGPSSISNSRVPDGRQPVGHDRGRSPLTTGEPVCGNLTAALRNRKKIQSAWDEAQYYLSQKYRPQNLLKAEENKTNGSGDYIDAEVDVISEVDLIEEDVLTTSKKWREVFRRFRSNNRARWEEENELDETNARGEEVFDLDKDRN